MTTKAFDSTIGVTIYNLLSTRGAASKVTLLADAIRLQHPDLELPQLERVLAEMVRRGRITVVGESVLLVDTAQARIVISRDIGDRFKGPELGGWDGWMVSDPSAVPGKSKKIRTLDGVLAEVAK